MHILVIEDESRIAKRIMRMTKEFFPEYGIRDNTYGIVD